MWWFIFIGLFIIGCLILAYIRVIEYCRYIDSLFEKELKERSSL